jgi:hypothetical protein
MLSAEHTPIGPGIELANPLNQLRRLDDTIVQLQAAAPARGAV